MKEKASSSIVQHLSKTAFLFSANIADEMSWYKENQSWFCI